MKIFDCKMTSEDKVNDPDWGKDELSRFLAEAEFNVKICCTKLRGIYDILNNINAVFLIVLQKVDFRSDLIPHFFIIRCHAALLAGIRLAMSSQIPETYMVLRGCLENALYGFYVKEDMSLQKLWLKRNDSEETKNKMKKIFSINKMQAKLNLKDPLICQNFSTLYERTIDFGAHPNNRGFLTVTEISSNTLNRTYKMGYLLGDDHPATRFGLKTCAQAGILALQIYQILYVDQFRAIGITRLIDKNKIGL